MSTRAEQELMFITSRMAAQREHREPRCWGLSSDALALYAVGKALEPTEWEYPSDTSDLMACVLTYRMAPDHLKERMAPILAKFRAHVEKRYPESWDRIEAYLNGDRSEWAKNGKGERSVSVKVRP